MQEGGQYWKQFLENSSDAKYRQLAEKVVVPINFIETYKSNKNCDTYEYETKEDFTVMPNMLKNVTENGNHVFLTSVTDGKFKIPCDCHFKKHNISNNLDDFYISKDELTGDSPW